MPDAKLTDEQLDEIEAELAEIREIPPGERTASARIYLEHVEPLLASERAHRAAEQRVRADVLDEVEGEVIAAFSDDTGRTALGGDVVLALLRDLRERWGLAALAGECDG